MKQRIRVVAIIRNGDGVLVFKKRRDRSEAPVFWELPTGKIAFGEQPEEAMARTLEEYAGLSAISLKIKDVVTFLAPEGASQLSNLYIVYEVEVSEEQKIELSDKYLAFKFLGNENKNSIRLEDASLSVLGILYDDVRGEEGNYRKAVNGATIFVDGCSRGNPGPSGVGYYIVGEDGKVLKSGGEFIGFATSRVAEYYALKEGIEQAKMLGLKTVRFINDNLMLINQMNGIYKVKNNDILPIYQEVKGMLKDFDACAFTHVKREHNREADREANNAVDRHFE